MAFRNDDQRLHNFCHEGNFRKVKDLLDDMKRQGIDVPMKLKQKLGVFGYTPLHQAVTDGHANVLQLLIDYGGFVNSKASSGYTPLHLAASGGHVECGRILLHSGADLNAKDEYQKSPLHTAELGARTNVVKVLRSAAIIKAVETNAVDLNDLLSVPRNKLEQDCLPRALKVATEKANAVNVGKIIIKGKDSLDIPGALKYAKELRAHAVRGLLLLVVAATNNNLDLLEALFCKEGCTYTSELIDDADFVHIQRAIRNKEVGTAVPIEIARWRKQQEIREELLMLTDVNQEEETVLWHGLRLTELELSWMKRIKWVKKLMLAKNDFATLPQEIGSYLSNVTKLNLQCNSLREFPRSLLELPYIQDLNLSHNKLQEIPEVHEWSNSLTILDLSHNELTTLPSYCEASNLKKLGLSHNKFRQVPLCICSMISLQFLDLGDNPDILNLPIEMGRLQNLVDLGLENLNDLNDPPRPIRINTKHCITYLNQKLRSTRGYYRMKLMLVGKQERGKTTLVARLQGKNVKESDNKSTVGVEVSEWKYSPRTIGRPFTFNVWDFGGQEEYYATHQCFLTQRSLYLLVWNITHGEEGVKEVKPWLDNIALRAPNSRVIIVATFYDKVSDEDKQSEGRATQLLRKVAKLAEKYLEKLQINRVTYVGLFGKQDNLEQLKKLIYDAAADYSISGEKVMGRAIPASYHSLDSHLAVIQKEIRLNQGNPIMHAPEFKDMIRSRNLADIYSDEEVKTATLFLCEVGSLLHYDDRKNNLDDLYFVDPRWLCDMMSTVVTIEQRNPYVKNGIIQRSSLPLLYRSKQFPTEFLDQYLVLLDRFEVALPLDQEKNLILIPSMLPADRPDDVDKPDDEICYERYIQFDIPTPPGFWSRLLARIMHSLTCVKSLLNLPSADIMKSFALLPVEEVQWQEESFERSKSTGLKEKVRHTLGLDKQLPIIKRRSLPTTKLGVSPAKSSISEDKEDSLNLTTPGIPEDKEESQCADGPSQPLISVPQMAMPLPQPVIRHAGAVLKYWKLGVCYRSTDLYILVEELQDTVNPSLHGVHVVVTPGHTGCTAYGQIVDLVVNLVEEWYPGLQKSKGSNILIEQLILCVECMKQGLPSPHKFPRETLVQNARDKVPEVECPVCKSTMFLADVAPDLFLADIDRHFLLDQDDVKYSQEDEERLGAGGFGTVFRGQCQGQSVAVKVFQGDSGNSDPLEAFSQLRNEAQVLKRNNHPGLVNMVGVLVFPHPALVMEEAPMGSLDGPLLKKKDPIGRIVLFRIAAQIASALAFLHSIGFIYRDLKAGNILLWSLGLDRLVNCKLADFGITASSAPIGVKGTRGTPGFIAPEVAYVGANHNRATYDYKADIFSYAMVLYQIISRHNPYYDVKPIHITQQIEQGKRPKVTEFPVSKTGLYFMTSLMKRCWKHLPNHRPTTAELIPRLMSPQVQLVMGVHPIFSSGRLSLRAACCAVLHPQSNPYQLDYTDPATVEFWICCDNYRGAEVQIYEASSMSLLRKHTIENNQVGCMTVCGENVWVASRAGLEYGVNEIYNAGSHQLKHRIRLRDTTVSTVAYNNTHVFIGTMEGYVFKYETTIALLQPEDYRPEKRCLSQHCVDGLAVIGPTLWLSHTRQMLFCSVKTLDIGASRSLPGDEYGRIGMIAANDRKTIVWSNEAGSPMLRAWRTQQQVIAYSLNVGNVLLGQDKSIGQKDAVISRVCSALDTVWCGMATGHILVFAEDQELLLCVRPYEDYIRFLVAVPSSGPCGKEDCMVLSGGKNYVEDSYLEDFSDDAFVKDKPKENSPQSPKAPESPTDATPAGTVILWEALRSGHMRQVKVCAGQDVWKSHENVRRIQDECFESRSATVSSSHLTLSERKTSSGSMSAVRHRVRTQSYAFDEIDVILPNGKGCALKIQKPVVLKRFLAEVAVVLESSEPSPEFCIEYEQDGQIVRISNQEILREYLTFKERPVLQVIVDETAKCESVDMKPVTSMKDSPSKSHASISGSLGKVVSSDSHFTNSKDVSETSNQSCNPTHSDGHHCDSCSSTDNVTATVDSSTEPLNHTASTATETASGTEPTSSTETMQGHNFEASVTSRPLPTTDSFSPTVSTTHDSDRATCVSGSSLSVATNDTISLELPCQQQTSETMN